MVIEPNILAFQNADLLDLIDRATENQIATTDGLAAAAKRDPSNLRKTLKRLIEDGLINEDPVSNGLTDEGRAQIAAFKRAQHGGERKRPRGQWPLDKFRPNPLNRPVRREVLPDMAASMRGPAGLVQRIRATEPDANGVRMIVDGEHRWESAKLLVEEAQDDPASDIPAWLADGMPFEEADADPATALVITLVANARRADMSPWDDARQLLKLQQATDWTASQLARHIGRVSEGERSGLRDVQQKLKIAREATPEAIADYERTGSWDTLRASVSTPKATIVLTRPQRLALAEIWHKAGRTQTDVAILPAGHAAEGARLAQYCLAILTRTDKGDLARITQAGVDYLKAERLDGAIEHARQMLGFPEGYGVAKLRTEWLNTPQDDDPWRGKGWTHVQTRNAPVAQIPAVRDATLALFKQTDERGDTRYRARFSAERMNGQLYVNRPIPGPSSEALAYQMAIEDMLKYEWPEAPRELIEWADRIAGPFVVAGKDCFNASRAQEARYALGWDKRQSNSGSASGAKAAEVELSADEPAAQTTRLTAADFGVPADWQADTVEDASAWMDPLTHQRAAFDAPGLTAVIEVAAIKGGKGWVQGSSASTRTSGHSSSLNGVWRGDTSAYKTPADAAWAAVGRIASTVGEKMTPRLRNWLNEAHLAFHAGGPETSAPSEADDADAFEPLPSAEVMRAHLQSMKEARHHPSDAALRLIADERQRQIEAEGFSWAEDDKHNEDGELALAAAAYAAAYTGEPDAALFWPRGWDPYMFKPSQDTRDLVRAGALIVAEIERRARQAAGGPPQ
ncbi:MAG: hypothetical protein ACK4OJ_04155 [Brevundimonas sp.]